MTSMGTGRRVPSGSGSMYFFRYSGVCIRQVLWRVQKSGCEIILFQRTWTGRSRTFPKETGLKSHGLMSP